MTAAPSPATTITEDEDPIMTITERTLPAPSASAARRRHVGDLPDILRSEWIKSTTVRANKILLVVAAVIGLLTSWATAVFNDEVLIASEVFVFPTTLTVVLAAIAGVLLFTSEVQHGTLAAALTARPARWPVVVAKAVVATGFGLMLGVIGLITGFAGAFAGGFEVGETSGVLATVGWALLYASGSAVLGLGVGMVVRHSAGAVSGVLVWWLVVEGLVVQFAPAEAVRFLPFDAGYRTLGIESDFDSPEIIASALSNTLHASIFWGYVLTALIIGTLLVHGRDAD
jgi:hypothetical protein